MRIEKKNRNVHRWFTFETLSQTHQNGKHNNKLKLKLLLYGILFLVAIYFLMVSLTIQQSTTTVASEKNPKDVYATTTNQLTNEITAVDDDDDSSYNTHQTKTNANDQNHDNFFLGYPSLETLDMYSGMWYTPINQFVHHIEFNTSSTLYVRPGQPKRPYKLESATFEILRYQKNIEFVQMTRNYLDFAVEHLSTFFRHLYMIDDNDNKNNYNNDGTAQQQVTNRTYLIHNNSEYLFSVSSEGLRDYVDRTKESMEVRKQRELMLQKQSSSTPVDDDDNSNFDSIDNLLKDHDETVSQDNVQQDDKDDDDDLVVQYVMKHTIAIVPFGLKPASAIVHRDSKFWIENNKTSYDFKIRLLSLQATVVSLLNVGISRIIIVGYDDNERSVVQPFLKEINDWYDENIDINNNNNSMLRHDKKEQQDNAIVFVNNNVPDPDLLPKHSITGLQDAMRGLYSYNDTIEWLGTNIQYTLPTTAPLDPTMNRTERAIISHPWKFVYFTEPDLILHTRPTTLHRIAKELNSTDRKIMMAHRLFLIQHESDFPKNVMNVTNKNEIVLMPTISNSNLSNIMMMSPNDVCFDSILPNGKPNRPGQFWTPCGKVKKWYRCGYELQVQSRSKSLNRTTGILNVPNENQYISTMPPKYNQQIHEQLFEPFLHYHFIRLQTGTRFVAIAASYQGRKCIPTINKNNE